MQQETLMRSLKYITVALAIFGTQQYAFAEPASITLDIQNGSNYMGMVVMQKYFWAEEAKKQGITTELKLNKVGGPAAASDRFLAGANQGMTISYPLIIKLNSKTNGDAKILFANAMTNMRLNTNSAEVKSAKDFKAGDKIAVTSLGTSIQAVANKMLADKILGDHKKLDPMTVQMSHPDAHTALMVGKITAHWSTPPFSQMQLEDKKIHTVASSYDLFGKHHLTAFVVSNKYCNENPKTCTALFESYKKANAWINADFARAAKFFQENVGAKETVDDYVKQLQNKDVEFNYVPQGIMSFSNALVKIGEAKSALKSWKDICMPVLAKENGGS